MMPIGPTHACPKNENNFSKSDFMYGMLNTTYKSH